MINHVGPHGPHAEFLRHFGPFLLQRYKPKAIVIFSAHWETSNQLEGMNLTSQTITNQQRY